MRQCGLGWVAAAVLLVASHAAGAQQQRSLADTVLEGCKTELETYCSQVTLGEGRLLACLYAHGDKLSGQCDFALYDAAVRLERAIAVISYVASECRADIQSLCVGVQAGQGRIAQCLKDHEAQLSQPCVQAVKDVGLE